MDLWFWLYASPWIFFVVWWLLRALSTAKTVSMESWGSRMTYRLVMAVAILLFTLPAHYRLGFLSHHLWYGSYALAVAGLVCEFVGIGFAVWARETIGRIWSGTITLKEGHRIVKEGPYRLARHPIYTGLMLALVGLMIPRGDVSGLLGVALFAVGIARKISIEEKLLGEHFAGEYAAYKQQVKAIIPFIL
jgi:protein-S-isoprenylcysteine O-methyltransferase Ste14